MNIYEKHLAAIEGNRIEKTNVIGLRKIFNAIHRRYRGYSVGYTSPKISFEQADSLLIAVRRGKPQVVRQDIAAAPNLHRSGLQVLRNPRYAKRWTPEQRAIIETLTHFRLVDFRDIGRGLYQPIYEAVSPKGTFQFMNVPWQSGGNGPEIV